MTRMPFLCTADAQPSGPAVGAKRLQMLIHRRATWWTFVIRSLPDLRRLRDTRLRRRRRKPRSLGSRRLERGKAIILLNVLVLTRIRRLFLQQGQSAGSIQCLRTLNKKNCTNIITKTIHENV